MKKNLSFPTISIILPTFNRKKYLCPLFTSLRKQNYPLSKIEVIAIDNGSKDGTPELIEKKFPWVKLIKLISNTGSVYPINKGVQKAKGEYILATNDDIVFSKNCLGYLIDLIKSDPKIGLVTGKMLNFYKPHYFAFPGFKINHFLGYHPYDRSRADLIRECDWASAGCLLLRKDLYLLSGGLDNDYFFGGDDYDLSFRLKAMGYHIFYHPRAVYYHPFPQGPLNPDKLYAHYQGKFRYALKNLSLLEIMTTFIAQIIIGPFYTYFFCGNKSFFPMLKALIWNLQHLKQTLKTRSKTKILIANFKKINAK